ncbi:MAG TPA: hypothetical protein VK604_16660 [Bryobacteraceae bacterium]|nr:hypothetical protein [Bryobacteraceae bacterium]
MIATDDPLGDINTPDSFGLIFLCANQETFLSLLYILKGQGAGINQVSHNGSAPAAEQVQQVIH